MAKEPDYYSLLGVDKDAPEREIKRAYYKLARELHPDRAKSPEEARENSEKLALISKAYNVLKDANKRASFDASRGNSSNTQSSQSSSPPKAPTSDRPQNQGKQSGETKGVDVNSGDMAAQKIATAQKAFVKGMQLYKVSDYKKALPFFEVAVQNDPETEPQYHLKLAQCLVKSKGSFTKAIQSAEKACEMDAYNIEYKLILADVYETVGVNSKAKSVYEDILKWDKENQRAKMKIQLMQAEDESKKSFLEKFLPNLFGKKS